MVEIETMYGYYIIENVLYMTRIFHYQRNGINQGKRAYSHESALGLAGFFEGGLGR